MRKRKLLIALVCFVFICGLFAGMETVADTSVKAVDIMFVHDTHSHLNEFLTVEDGKSQNLGGFARIKTLIDIQKEANPDTLLLDAGDFAMGTLIQVMFAEEAPELRMLGTLGFDVTTLGNHEFDYKAQGLADMMNRAVESGEKLPELVLCNVDWERMETEGLTPDQQLLKDAFENIGVKEYVVVEKNDVRIAVTGVFGEDALACVPNCPILFKDPVEAVKETVAKIHESENVDMLVCVSHSGTWEREDKSEDEILAKQVPELDLIVSGHTHTKLERPIVHGNTYIVSAGEYGKYLGSLSMSMQNDGRWKMEEYELLKVDESVNSDEATQARIDEFSALIDSKYLKRFGYAGQQILCTNEIEFVAGPDSLSENTEMNLGSIMADAYTYAVETFGDNDSNPVDVAVVPAGTIRDTYAKGVITPQQVFNSFSLGIGADGVPGYPLISVYLTGKELKIAAEIDASVSELMSTAKLYTDGLYWTYNPHRMFLNRVTDVYLCDGNEERVELDDHKLYRVVADFYTSQMLGGVTDLSYGLLSVVPKHADGTPIANYEDAIITADGEELKAWVAIAHYMNSFEDTDGDGVGNVPAKYGTVEGRKVVEESKNILDLVKNPNKFFFIISGILLLVVIIVVISIKNIIKMILKKCAGKS